MLHHGDLDDVGEESFGDDVALPGFRHLSLSSMPEPPDLPEQMFSQLTSLDWMLESNEVQSLALLIHLCVHYARFADLLVCCSVADAPALAEACGRSDPPWLRRVQI